MPTYANPPKDGDFVRILMKAGPQPLICCDVMDRGMHEDEWQGVVKMKPKVSLHFLSADIIPATWTHPYSQETIQVPEVMVGKPFGISRWFTNSMDDRAALRQFLVAWRGRDFTDAEAERFDLDTLINVPAMGNVVHKQSQNGGKWYAKLHSAMGMDRADAPTIPDDYVRLRDRVPQDGQQVQQPAAQPVATLAGDSHGYGPGVSDDPIPESVNSGIADQDDGLPF